jgi:glycosyltransferase involved in cell wall biosynthesis
MNKISKIIFISNTDGALFKFRSSLIQKLKYEKLKVIGIASPCSPEGTYKEKLEIICDKYYIVDFFRQMKLSFIYSPFKIFKIIKYEKPSVIHVFGHEALFYSFLLLFLKKDYKVILTITGLGRFFQKNSKWYIFFVKNFIVKFYEISLIKIDAVIFLNSHDFNLFCNLFPKYIEKFKHIYGEGSRFSSLNSIFIDETSDVKNFLFASRIMKDKGILELIKAFQNLPDEYNLTILGTIDDNLKNNDLIIAAKLGNFNNIKYFGFVEDITPFLESAHCVILPSKYMEGLPIILVETLSKGKLIITSKSPGCADTVITNQNGILLDKVDPESIVNAVLKISFFDKLNARDVSIKLFEDKFSSHVVNNLIFNIYNSI